MKVVVARLSDFPDGTRRIVRVGGREIGVFRVGDRFYGVRNRCPHQGGPLCEGRVCPKVVSELPGRVEWADGVWLACPWHGWRFDMETGVPHAPDDPGVRTYDVAVERSVAGLQLPELPGPAEVFDVSVEDDYVVVDA